MDPVPLVILGVVLVGAAVLVPFLVKLKRAARQALEAARGLEARLEAMRTERTGGASGDGGPPPEGPARG